MEPADRLTTVSLLRKLYRGDVTLSQTYWGYWFGLGMLTCLLWCLVLLLPSYFFMDFVIDTLVSYIKEFDTGSGGSGSDALGWLDHASWLVIFLVPLAVFPGYTFYHTALLGWPIWKTLKNEPADTFWGKTGGKVLALFPIVTILAVGLILVVLGLLMSVVSGPLAIIGKVLGFLIGMIPHGVVLIALWLIPAQIELPPELEPEPADAVPQQSRVIARETIADPTDDRTES